ncbi:hypothetical protein [Eubacterium ramulus]
MYPSDSRMPDVLGKLLSYLSNITSGMSMLVVGLSLSRLPVKAVSRIAG